MKNYIPKWEAVDIPKEQYLELLHFCHQYPEWKAEVASAAGPRAVQYDKVHTGNNPLFDPVLAAVERREVYQKKIHMIDSCAAEIDGGKWYTAIIQNVCFERPYSMLDPCVLPTSDRNSFFRAKKAFFVLLSRTRDSSL